MKTLLIALALAVSAISHAAPVQVSVIGTAQTTEMGYTAGQSYTFNWTVNDGYDGSGIFTETYNRWSVEYTTDPLLLSSVSGDGLLGTYSRPSGISYAPYEFIHANSDGLHLYTENDYPEGSSMGLWVDGKQVSRVYANHLDIPGLDYSDTSFVNPSSWLAGYAGTHVLSGGNMNVRDESNNSIWFTPTSVTVIPEPATLGLIGLVTGGIYFTRRFFVV